MTGIREGKRRKEELLWETEFFAISIITGRVRVYNGMLIQAESFVSAYEKLRDLKQDFLQLNGVWYKDPDIQEAKRESKEMRRKVAKENDKPIKSIKVINEDFSYDEFMDWLDGFSTSAGIKKVLTQYERKGLEKEMEIIKLYLRDVNGS